MPIAARLARADRSRAFTSSRRCETPTGTPVSLVPPSPGRRDTMITSAVGAAAGRLRILARSRGCRRWHATCFTHADVKQIDPRWIRAFVWTLALLLPGGFVLLSAFLIIQRRTRSRSEVTPAESVGLASEAEPGASLGAVAA